jgi:hypothetical protein
MSESDTVFLVSWSRAARLLDCTTRTLDRRAKTDPRHNPTVVGSRKYLRSSQIEAIQQNRTEDEIQAAKAGLILPRPKASPFDRIGAIDAEAADPR